MELTLLEQSELQQYEITIERGLKTFVDVGNALLAIRDGRLYRRDYGTFEDYCQDRWGFSRQFASYQIQAASAMSNLSTIVDKLPERETHIRPLTSLDPEAQREVWQAAVATAPNGKVTAAHVEQTKREYLTPLWSADGESGDPEPYEDDEWTPPTSKPHVANNSGNNEWYTPAEYIEGARWVLGSIDLDPASSPQANEIVKAGSIYTAETNGLEAEWWGNVWLNPPYASDLITQFCEKLVSAYVAGKITNAIVLVNNATETAWFHLLAGCASHICFPKSRIKYWGPNGVQNSPLQGQAFLYFGDDGERFKMQFREFGFVVEVVQ